MGLQFGQFLQQFVFTPIVELLLTNQSFTIHEGRRAIDTRGKAKPGHVLSFSNTAKNWWTGKAAANPTKDAVNPTKDVVRFLINLLKSAYISWIINHKLYDSWILWRKQSVHDSWIWWSQSFIYFLIHRFCEFIISNSWNIWINSKRLHPQENSFETPCMGTESKKQIHPWKSHQNKNSRSLQTTYCFRGNDHDSLKNRTNLNLGRFPSNLRSSQSVPRSIKSYKTFGRAALHSAEGIWRRLEPLQYATASLKSLESAKRSVSNDNSWNSSRTVFSADTLEMGIKKEFGNSYWILFSCSLTRNEANNT